MEKELFGSYLRNLRKQKNLSQEYLASFLGIKRQTYSTYETGRIFPPTDILLKLAQYYNVSFESVLLSAENQAPKLSAVSLLYDSKSFAQESELLNLFRSVEKRDQEDIIDFLKVKVHQYRNGINPHKYL